MKFISSSVLVTFGLIIVVTNGQVLYGTPYVSQFQQQYKYPLPYGYSYANQNQAYMQPQQPVLYQQQNLLPVPGGYPQQYGLAPQYPAPYYPGRPAVVEEILLPNSATKVTSASLETPIDDDGNSDAALLGIIAQNDPNAHAEEYYWARGDPSVVGSNPEFRRAAVLRPRQPQSPTIKKPFSVKKRQHFELYKYH